ncbi:membrane protein [Sphaerisporangium siamense]|uniref:Putative membrane protein n=1 Tax=Sphaerisporangium siamense TaxID=795645 RepID=A0A7W7DE44_9ACTN|nr:carotenoid biosynthesis protein [Sphaerisporangium siamense]MBB4705195.1 putative membrane protein [Sphaerisporangium siamense]GII84003.1 membrane protein [Sphaerisporangium siamense]
MRTTETPEEARTGDARRGPGRRFAAAGAFLLVAMICAQVVTGLLPEDVRMTTLVVVLFAGCALAYAAAGHGPARAAGAFAAAAAVGYAAEWIGIRTGLPFGDYRYGGLLWPSPGGVPLIVALAWAGMGLAAWAVACRIVPGRSRRRAAARAATGALALTAWDLFLDPQMTRLGLWEWADAGPYRGVPLSNFAGWLVVSLLVMVVIGAVAGEPVRGGGLVALYTVMAVMETVAFAAVFRPPDPLVAAVGGAAMGTFALLAWRRRWRR